MNLNRNINTLKNTLIYVNEIVITDPKRKKRRSRENTHLVLSLFNKS